MLSDRCLSVCDIGVLWQNGCMDRMKLGMEVGLGTGHIVLDADRPCPFFIDTRLSGKRRCRLNLRRLSYVKPYHKS